MTKVGIDALYVYSPEYYVDNAELALARGNAPKHFTEGVGVKTFSVAPPNEDQASMAATAAHRLMESYRVSPKEIFRIDTPTNASTVTIQFSGPSGAALPAAVRPQLSIFRLPPGQ